jgi:hypothetical protein
MIGMSKTRHGMDLGTRVAILSIMLFILIQGIQWVATAGQELPEMERTFLTNRATLALILWALIITGYSWFSFKPKGWRIPSDITPDSLPSSYLKYPLGPREKKKKLSN